MSEVAAAATLVLAMVLGAAAVGKAQSLTTFAEHIADHDLIPYGLTRAVAAGVIATEAAAAGLLLVPGLRRIGAVVAVALLFTFIALMSRAWIQGRDVSCGCFGGNEESDRVAAHSLTRTGILAGLALLVATHPASPIDSASLLLGVQIGIAVFLIAEVVRLMTDLRSSSSRLAESFSGRFADDQE